MFPSVVMTSAKYTGVENHVEIQKYLKKNIFKNEEAFQELGVTFKNEEILSDEKGI